MRWHYSTNLFIWIPDNSLDSRLAMQSSRILELTNTFRLHIGLYDDVDISAIETLRASDHDLATTYRTPMFGF